MVSRRYISIFLVLILNLLSFYACDSIKKKTKDSINKGGETVGKSATEFFEGVSEGVEKTLECEVVLSEGLKEKGVEFGKYFIESNSVNGNKNKLVIYLMFNNSFKGDIRVKVFDKNEVEIGRSKLNVVAEAEDASYYNFDFDRRTQIEFRSKILIE